MALKSTTNGSQYLLDHEILSGQFNVIPFKDLTVINENFDYTESWLQNQRHELAVYASSYFIESGKVETEFKRLETKRKALNIFTVNGDIPLRANVNMDGMRACLFETQKQHEIVLAARGNIQFAWICNQDKRLVNLNEKLLQLDKDWQGLINEIQKFIDPEFELQKKAEKNPDVKSKEDNEVTVKIPQMLEGMQREHLEYTI